MQAQRTIITPIVLWISLAMTGCATDSKNAMLPQEGRTMKEVYDAHFGRSRLPEDIARDAMRSRKINKGPADLFGYTRAVNNEIDALFPRLPNPTLVLYVFPHLTGPAANPVPGMPQVSRCTRRWSTHCLAKCPDIAGRPSNPRTSEQ